MSEEREKKSVVKIIFLVLLCIILLGIIACAVVQFTGIYDFRKLIKNEKIANMVGYYDSEEIIYKENEVAEINELFANYYAAMVSCDQDVLKASVTDFTIFDDMTGTMQKAMIYTGYENIVCYTVNGIKDDEYIVYVMCNINIAGVNCKPLDISSYYVVNTTSGYKIDNGVHSAEVTELIATSSQSDSVQALYQKVSEDINYWIENDQTFADFYSEINSYN